MTDCITTAIAEATAILSASLLKQSPDIGGDVDEQVQGLVREVGRHVVREVIQQRCEGLVESGKTRGLVTQRRPVVRFYTVFGAISVESPYMWCAVDQFGWRPLRETFGVVDRGRSRRLERALVDFGSDRSYGKAADAFVEHYGWELGRTTIRSATQAEALRAERFIDELFDEFSRLYQQPIAERRGATHLVAELDGCEIRTGELMSVRRALRYDLPPEQMVRPERWREVRTAFARGLHEVDATYVCRIGSYDEVTEQMFGAACNHGLTEQTTVVAPCDGAFGLREALEERFPRLKFVLDYPHLKGHVYETAEALGLADGLKQRWAETLLDDVWNGRVVEVLERLADKYRQSGNQRLRRLIEYIERFEDSVDYAKLVERGWPVGSGEVESAHRFIPQARLKIPGACWRVESVNPMLALRLLKANGCWARYWQEDKDRQAAA